MNQLEFIQKAKAARPAVKSIEQTLVGKVIVNLTDDIQLIHYYIENNKMSIIFKDDNTKYLAEDKDIDWIYYFNNGNNTDYIRQLCEKNELKKI